MAERYKYNDEDLGRFVENELSNAEGAESNERQQHNSMALQYYYNETRGDEKPGESTVQSSDLADMTNAVLAQLTPMISTDALVAFEPSGADDENAARSESNAVNDVVMDKNAGYTELQQSLKDAALAANAVACVYYEDVETVEIRSFSDVGRRDLNRAAKVIRDQGAEAEAQNYDEENRAGQVKIVLKERKFKWRAVDPINVSYQAGWDSLSIEGIRFFAERDTPTRSELLAEGYDQSDIDELPALTQEYRTEAHARRRGMNADDQAQTTDQEQVERHTCFMLIDMDGDGISELWKVVVGDRRNVLGKEMVQWIPYAVGSMFLASHRLMGEDLYDRLKQTQDVKTGAYRRWLDNLYAGTWGRTVANKMTVDPGIDDARAAKTIWTKGPPSDNVMVLPVVDIGASALQLLQYEDQRRTERGGAALDMQAADAQLVGETMGGIMKQYSVKEQLAQMMAKNLGETLIRQIYLLMHRTLRTFGTKEIPIKLRGQTTMVRPSDWKPRTSVNVTPGLTPSARAAMEQAMIMLLQFGQQAMAQGQEGQLVTKSNIYRAACDFARAKGVDNPDQYVTDPESPPALEAAQRAQQSAIQAQQMQMQMLQAQLGIEQAKVEQQRQKANQDLFASLYKTDVDAELKEAELISEGQIARIDAAERARASAASTTAQAGGNSGG